MSLLNKDNEEYQLLDTAREILRNPIFSVTEKLNSFYSKDDTDFGSITTEKKLKGSFNGDSINCVVSSQHGSSTTISSGVNKTINPYKVLELQKVNLKYNKNAKPYVTIDVDLEDYEYLRNSFVIPYLNNKDLSFELHTESCLLKCELYHKTQLIFYTGEQFSIDLYRQDKNTQERYIGFIENFKSLGKYKKYVSINNTPYLVMLGETYNEDANGENAYNGEYYGFYQYRLLRMSNNLIENIKLICNDFHYIEDMNFRPHKFIISKKFYIKLRDSLEKLIFEIKSKGYEVELIIINEDGSEIKEKEIKVVKNKLQESTNIAKDFIAITPKGKKIEASNITQFAKENNLNKKSISACLNKRQKTHKKWRFKFVNA